MAQDATQVTSSRKRDAGNKLAAHRLSVLELARELGKVTEACRRRGLNRTRFYEWRRRFQPHGFRRAHGSAANPQEPPPDDATGDAGTGQGVGVGASGLWVRLEAMLSLEGRRVSSITIQKILDDNGLGTRQDRWLGLEKANADKALELTAEQAAFLEKLNPCFRERHVESAAPGDLLSADTFLVGSLKGAGTVSLHAEVDAYGSYAFGFLHVPKQPEAAVAVLNNNVLPSAADKTRGEGGLDGQREGVLWD